MKRFSFREQMKNSDNLTQAVAVGIAVGIVVGIIIDMYFTPIVEVAHAEEVVQIEPVEVLVEINYNWDIERAKEEIRKVFPEDPETAIKIAKCESGFKMIRSNHQWRGIQEPSYGIFQIFSPSWENTAIRLGLEDYRTNPNSNLKMARFIYDTGGKSWMPWSCYSKRMI